MKRQILYLTTGLLFMLAGLAAMPQGEQPTRARYEYRAEHDPNGIGKFYMGREIAQVMGHEAADWLDRPEREAEEGPSILLQPLKLKPGMVVADIGAGSGYLSLRMAKMVAPRGKVYAEDIVLAMLDIIRRKMRDEDGTEEVSALGTITDPKLPA